MLDQTKDLVCLSCLVLTVSLKLKLIINDNPKIILFLGTLNGHIGTCRVNHVITMAGIVWTKMKDFAFVWVELKHPGCCPQTEVVEIFLQRRAIFYRGCWTKEFGIVHRQFQAILDHHRSVIYIEFELCWA